MTPLVSDRIILINPPIALEQIYGNFARSAPVLPPLGILYLASFLEARDYHVEIIDAFAERLQTDTIIDYLCRDRPAIVGVTATTVSYWSARNLIESLRRELPEIVIVIGGAHISACPEKTIRELPEGVLGIMGEGENAFAALCDSIFHSKKDFNTIPSLIMRNGDSIHQTKRAPLIEDLDTVPIPARHLLPSLELYSHTMVRGWKRSVSIISSRGCPFLCGYCDQSVFQRSWRAHSPRYVVDEIKTVFSQFGKRFVSFEDDNFNLKNQRMVDFCRLVLDERLAFSWGCSLRLADLHVEHLSLMREAGCRLIYVGLESGNDRVKKLLNKDMPRGEVETKVKAIKAANIGIYASFMLGIPTETRNEMEDTIRFARSLTLDGVSFFLFTPYDRVPLTQLAMEHGTIADDYRYYSAHTNKPVYVPNGFTADELLAIQKHAYRHALLHPRFIAHNLRKLASPRLIQLAIDVILRR